MDDFDVVVVGGGLAGLAAATWCARSEKRVLLLERATHVGGRAVTHREHGFDLNLGPHAFYLGAEAGAAMRDLGIAPQGRKAPARGHALHDGRLHRLPVGPASLIASGLLSTAEKIDLGRVLARIGSLDPHAYADVSVTEWIARITRRPRARQLIEAIVRVSTYANTPEQLSADAAIRQLALALDPGVGYLDHGWQSLVDALGARAAAAGVTVRQGARVTGVSDGEVRLGDETIRAGAAILCTGPDTVAKLVGGITRSWAAEAVEARATCLDLALHPGATIATPFILGVDEPTYLSLHSDTARLAPPGGLVIHAARYLAPGEKPPPRAQLEALVDRAIPDWRAHVAVARFLPQMTVVNALPLARSGGLAGRPGVVVPGTSRVFVAGDWVGARGMLLDAALGSARDAATAAVAALASLASSRGGLETAA